MAPRCAGVSSFLEPIAFQIEVGSGSSDELNPNKRVSLMVKRVNKMPIAIFMKFDVNTSDGALEIEIKKKKSGYFWRPSVGRTIGTPGPRFHGNPNRGTRAGGDSAG